MDELSHVWVENFFFSFKDVFFSIFNIFIFVISFCFKIEQNLLEASSAGPPSVDEILIQSKNTDKVRHSSIIFTKKFLY